MATKRANFGITTSGSLLCNEFYEGHSTYTSSTDLPFYPSTDYYACADSINEEGMTCFQYNNSSKELRCNFLYEGDMDDYNSQHYVTGSATTLAELAANFDPVFKLDLANNTATVENFNIFKTEVERLAGSLTITNIRVAIVDKKCRHTTSGGSNIHISFCGFSPISHAPHKVSTFGSGYIVRDYPAHFCGVTTYVKDNVDGNKKYFPKDWAAQTSHPDVTFQTQDISEFLEICNNRYISKSDRTLGRRSRACSICYVFDTFDGNTCLHYYTPVARLWYVVTKSPNDGEGITNRFVSDSPLIY